MNAPKARPGNAAARARMDEMEAALRYQARRTGLGMDYLRHGPSSERAAALEAYRNRRGAKEVGA